MKYKLLLLDIDGTLVASKGDALPSPAVVRAVQAAQQHLTVAVATGRPAQLALPVVHALRLHGFGIYNGGAQVINTLDDSIMREQKLSVDTMREVVRLVKPYDYAITDDTSQYEKVINAPEEINEPAAKLFIEAVPTKIALNIAAEINGIKDVIAQPTTSWMDGDVVDIHINHALATKEHGAEYLADHLGIAKADIIAIGDSYNDVPLLEAAGLKVVMGDAPTEVKAIADYVTASLQDDGVAEAIERFILTN